MHVQYNRGYTGFAMDTSALCLVCAVGKIGGFLLRLQPLFFHTTTTTSQRVGIVTHDKMRLFYIFVQAGFKPCVCHRSQSHY